MTPEIDQDDADWLDLLAGRAVANARPSCRVEATWLRAAMLSFRPVIPRGDVPDPKLRLHSLLAKAELAGLIEGTPPPRESRLGSPVKRMSDALLSRLKVLANLLFRSPTAWATAAVLAMAVILSLPSSDEPDGSVMRGNSEQQLVSTDPAALQQQMATELSGRGFEVTSFERLGRPGLELTLKGRPSAEQLAALRRAGLSWPDGPQLVVEFVQEADASKK